MVMYILSVLAMLCVCTLANETTEKDPSLYYLQYKWALFFNFLDTGKIGLISETTEKDNEQMMIDLTNNDDKLTHEKYHHIWVSVIFYGNPQKLNVEEFVRLSLNLFLEDEKNFTMTMQQACHDAYSIVDVGTEVEVTESEFINVFKSFGMKDDDWSKRLFHAHNPTNGIILASTACEKWLQFSVDRNPLKKDIVRLAMEELLK